MAMLKKLRGLLRRRPVDAERALRWAQAEAQQRVMRERSNHIGGMTGSGGIGEGGGM